MSVAGRAASVLGGGGSFDLCDDLDGLEGTREILEAYKRGAFGDQTTGGERTKRPKIEDLILNENEQKGIAV